MADLIDSVADLIDGRDRDGLEATLARIAFELAGARALTFWRVYRRGRADVLLRRRVVLPPTLRALASPKAMKFRRRGGGAAPPGFRVEEFRALA